MISKFVLNLKIKQFVQIDWRNKVKLWYDNLTSRISLLKVGD